MDMDRLYRAAERQHINKYVVQTPFGNKHFRTLEKAKAFCQRFFAETGFILSIEKMRTEHECRIYKLDGAVIERW